MQKNSSGYRAMLRRALRDRQRKNPAYSLRAYARDLGISYSHLHALLRGEKGASLAAARKIAGALALAGEEERRFIKSVEAELARKRKASLRARPRI